MTLGARLPVAARPVWVVVIVCLTCGCGFHLRSWNLESSVSSVHVDAGSGNFATQSLRRSLEQAGVELVSTADEAQVVVVLLDERRDRRSVSVTDQARAAEYEIGLGIRYTIKGAEGTTLVPNTWVESSRIFSVDRVNLIGNSEEQALLEREMLNDLVQQIIRALDVATREPAVAV